MADESLFAVLVCSSLASFVGALLGSMTFWSVYVQRNAQSTEEEHG